MGQRAAGSTTLATGVVLAPLPSTTKHTGALVMRKVRVFNNVSLDGYFTDANNDYRWAHHGANDPELIEFTKGNAQGTSALIFGRKTYEIMVSWWPTPEAAKAMPQVAKGMNQAPKYVFSKTLDSADWSNTTLLKEDPTTAIARIKPTDGPDMTVLGSGTIVSQLTEARLVDEIQLMVVPVVLGSGKSHFANVTGQPWWELTRSKTFKNGRAFLAYTPRD